VRSRVREKIAATAHNQLAGSLLRQGRSDAGGGKPIKQAVYARQLAASLHIEKLARQTLSAWERGASVVPAAALLASAEVNGVDVGQLVEAARDNVKARIADLEAQLLTTSRKRAHEDGHDPSLQVVRANEAEKKVRTRH